MNTELVFKDYYKKSKAEITKLIKKFVDEDFFTVFPDLKDKVSIIVTGSVSHGKCDKESDIDLSIVFYNEEERKEKKFLIVDAFRDKNKVPLKKPIEIHGGNMYSLQKLEEELSSWNKDWLLGEISQAIIIYDPSHKFEKLQIKYAWYPDKILKEKMNWLFSESTFLIFDRYQTASKRKNLYYTEVVKLKVLRLFMLSFILANKKYPHSDKHLVNDLRSLGKNGVVIAEQIENIIKKKNMSAIFDDLMIIRKKIEALLIKKSFIVKKDIDYWIGLRTTYKVIIEE